MNDFDEGADIGQVNGLMSPEAAKIISAHRLVEGKEYSCQVCGKSYAAPFVSRCGCGLRVCDNCMSDHYNGM